MAPNRRKSLGASPRTSNNFEYLKSIGEFKKTIRRRETLRALKTGRERDLEQRIALEVKICEGSTKLLAACEPKGMYTNQPHTLEAAKNLLVSNERMTAYMSELKNTKCRRPNPTVKSSLGRICVSDLRFPLIWKDSDHFKNKGDHRRFAVFVLLKIGTEIQDTVLINLVDRSMTDICFDDIIIFNEIPHDFECSLEIYSHVHQNDFSIASTPRKLRRSIHNSISKTIGKKIAASLKDNSLNDVGPKFDLVGTATLKVSNLSNNISSFDLIIENRENKNHQLPLFGNFCCKLAAQPLCATQEKISGFVNIMENENKKSWCRLNGWRFEIWESKDDVETSPYHPLSLTIDRKTEVKHISSSVLNITNKSGLERGSFTMEFETVENLKNWSQVINQQISNHEVWGIAAEDDMEILTPQPTRKNFMLPLESKNTLYEDTPLKEGLQTSEISMYNEIYNSSNFTNTFCTKPQTTAQTKPYTLSNRSSFRRWGSVKCNMPFFKTKLN